MFYSNVTGCTQGMYFCCFAFYLLIALLYYPRYSSHTNLSCFNKINPFFSLLVLVYILTSCYNGDFWHYKDFMLDHDSFWAPSEKIYLLIAQFVGDNYLLFRIVVWGGAYILLLKIFKILQLNINSALLYFFILYISVFDYARVSLAMAMFFIGYIYTIMPQSNLFSKSIGWLGIGCSYFFHHSMIVLILLSFMRYVPINKKTVSILILIIPIVAMLVSRVFFSVMGLGSDSLELVTMKMENYSELDTTTDISFLEKVRLFWHYSTFFIPFIISTYKLIYKPILKYPSFIIKLYGITLGILLFSISTLFLGFENRVLFYRTLYMSMIPLTILICYLHDNNVIRNKTFKRLMFLGLGYSIFRHSKVLLRWTGPIK